ncbi:hypothetical protein AJ79_07798 [Helicocarpus griseus UAMH5409]|uniref:FAD-binding PCMH-type domain-containing protein n=1 Tax=Helicocarpus griseus UAMH5409 TaxID=1447875 RepID=A0A2B7WZ99_9EURO|nr:hypothetical protein AJ79_07798 [Helicocarpus griseus UAMH5409]
MVRLLSLAAVAAFCTTGSIAALTCEKIATISNIEIEEPFSIPYAEDQKEYWSSECGRLKPSCILVPKSLDELSIIVKTLGENDDRFAIKSGGHNPNRNFSSIDDAPLITLKAFNEINYDEASGTVRVGAGNRWTDVVKALEPSGVTAVGGRIGHVGVGGYIVGGGLSYLSTQTGWAMNTVVEFDVVLASGEIVKASSTENVDLFNVLRGGGNAFGIVTTYTLKAHKMGQIWGGNLIIGGDKTNEVLAAVRDFTEYYPDDKAAVIATHDITLVDLVDIWLLFLFYDGETPPPGTFDNFTNIGPILNTAKTQSYSDFVSAQDGLVITGQIYDMATELSTLPSANNAEVMQAINGHFETVSMENKFVSGLVATMALQPIPKRLARHAKENGGDLMDLDDSVDRLLIELNYSYNFPSDVPTVEGALKKMTNGMRKDILDLIANGTLADAHLPLFMNDAHHSQDYFGRLRPEKLEYVKKIREVYDPENFFRDRTGGFKMGN